MRWLILFLFPAGFWFGVLVEHVPPLVSTPIVPLTTEEREKTWLYQAIYPTTVLVRIKTAEEINEAAKGISANADAIAFPAGKLCEIWLPEGPEIVFSPRMKHAIWVKRYDGDLFAHELLHCLRGSWHAQ